MKATLENISTFENSLQRRMEKRKRIALAAMAGSVVYALVRIFSWLVEAVIAFAVMCIATLPLYAMLLVRKIFTGKPVYYSDYCLGYKGRKVKLYYFNMRRYYLKNLSLFMHVIEGKLSLAGIAIRPYSQHERNLGDSYLLGGKPGIFSLWYIRNSSKIGHGQREDIEWEYVFKKSLVKDLILLAKSIPAFFYHSENVNTRDRVNLFDLEFDNITMTEAVNLVGEIVETRQKKTAFFVNPDCLNKIFSDKDYYNVLKDSEYIFPDGIGVNIACKIIGEPLRENVNGTDMLPFLCQMCESNSRSIYLLGGGELVAQTMRDKLCQKYENLSIVGARDGFFDRETETDSVIEDINLSGADVLLVAFGAPLQEKWIARNRDKLHCNVLMGVGGLFDFYSERTQRAPAWMREIGIEWVYRLMQEPGRMWRRYIIGNPLFVYRVLKWKLQTGICR